MYSRACSNIALHSFLVFLGGGTSTFFGWAGCLIQLEVVVGISGGNNYRYRKGVYTYSNELHKNIWIAHSIRTLSPHGRDSGEVQGDQLGAKFHLLCDCFLWADSWKFEMLPKFSGYLFPRVLILTETGWATFWAFFSRAHPVTLVRWKLKAEQTCLQIFFFTVSSFGCKGDRLLGLRVATSCAYKKTETCLQSSLQFAALLQI
jgi:hypothetical protein